MDSLRKKIQNDFKQALKEKDKLKISTLRLLQAALLIKEKEKREKIVKIKGQLSEKVLQEESLLSDEEILDILSSEIKKRREAIQEFQKGGRDDLVEREKRELKILEKYLPAQISNEELKQLINKAIKELKIQNSQEIGKVMAFLMPKLKGRAEGRRVVQLVKEILLKTFQQTKWTKKNS